MSKSACAHPTFLFALALLVLNDHFLKGSGTHPLITGKLSDFAGLIVGPVVFATLASPFGRAARVAAFSGVVLVFTAVNLFSPAARAVESLSGTLGVTWQLWVDPSDLVALVVVPWAARLAFGPVVHRAAPGRRRGPSPLEALGVVAGATACLATSARPASFSTRAYLVNSTGENIEVRLSRFDATVDCSLFAGRESFVLERDRFELEATYRLGRRKVLPLDEDDEQADREPSECGAVMLDVDGMETIVVSWAEGRRMSVPEFMDRRDAGEQGVVLRSSDEGITARVGDALVALDLEELDREPTCSAAPEVGRPLEWSGFERGEWLVRDVVAGGDDCLRIDLSQPVLGDAGAGDVESAVLCAPRDTFPFGAGDVLYVEPIADSLQLWFRGGPLVIVTYQRREQPRQSEPIDCDGAELPCGAVVVPIAFSVSGRTERLLPGDILTEQDSGSQRTTFILRAEQVVRVGDGCGVAREDLGPTVDRVTIEEEIVP